MFIYNSLIGIVNEFWFLYVEMAFYMLIGLLFVGVLHVIISPEFVTKHTGKKGLLSVIKASLFGVPLPLCSCGVLPTAIFMRKEGASKGATTSFLISTPQTGIDSIVATYGMLGPVMAIFRPIAAFVMGVFGGWFIDKIDKDEIKIPQKTMQTSINDEPGASSCCCGGKETKEKTEPVAKSCCHEKAPEPVVTVKSCCTTVPDKKRSLKEKLKVIFTYGFSSFLDDIVGHFIVGLILATLISYFLPDDIATRLNISDGLAGMLLMIAIGLPMYICATSSIPIAVAFMMKGFSPGTAFVFLAVGPATNAAAIAMISKILGKKLTVWFVIVLSVTAIAMGLLLDWIFEIGGFDPTQLILMGHESHIFTYPMKLVGTFIFSAILALSVYRVYIKKFFNKVRA